MTTSEDALSRYLPFLLEIIRRLLLIFSLFLIAWVLGFIYYEKIVFFALKLLDLKGVNIVFTSPFQFIELGFSCGLIVGLVVIFPFSIIQALSFLKPALKPKEYRLILFLLPFSILLFVLGFFFGALMMKSIINLFYQKSIQLNIGNYLDISRLLANILITAGLMGLAFQFPLVITILLHLGIINQKTISNLRLFVYLGIFLFVMMLPPTDILSDFLLTLPLVFLFEITLILNKLIFKNSQK